MSSSVIDDAKTLEYEWGCLFRYEPEDWSRVPEDHWLHHSFRYTAGIPGTPYLTLDGSSAAAHLAGKDDALKKVAPLLALMPDWVGAPQQRPGG